VRGRVAALDRKLMQRVAATDSRAFDHLLPALSRAANHSMLWMAISARAGRQRRQVGQAGGAARPATRCLSTSGSPASGIS